MGFPILVVGEGTAVMLLDLAAFALILRVYLKNKRKSALFFSLAWLTDFFVMLAAFMGKGYLNSLLLTLFGAMLFYSAIEFLKEEKESITLAEVSKLALPPIGVVFYMLLFLELKAPNIPLSEVYANILLGVAWSNAAFLAISAGFFFKKLIPMYKHAKHIYWGLIFFGLHLFPYPFFHDLTWYAPIGLTLSMILIAWLVYYMVSMVSSEQFNKIEVPEMKEIKLEEGVLIIGSSEYEEIKRMLEEFPVLAFIRMIRDVPSTWRYYFVTTAGDERENAISPTDLGKISELSYRYLKATEEKGRGIILIDCVEYLLMYNELNSVLKFLTKLRDFVKLYNGTLVLVIEKEALGKKDYSLIERLLE